MSTDDRVLEYHYPADHQYSLAHVTDDCERHEQQLADFAADDAYTTQTVVDKMGNSTVYLIYTNTAPDTALPEWETEDEIRAWLRETFDPETLPIVLAVWRAYRGVLDEEQAAGNELELYKQMQLEKIPDIVERVEWGQPVPAVGADLLSGFIRAHPMPNTNHRTGISLLERYLSSVATTFQMPPTGETGEWYEWAVDYVHESKRLLTLRRKLPVCRYAATVGYERLRRKEGVEIDLTSINLERSDYFEHYSTAHHERTREFVDELLDQADATALREQTDDGKQAFVDRLRTDQ